MSGILGTFAVKVGTFVSRFLSEVVASVVMTACVAGATAAYLNYESLATKASKKEPDLATLLAPAADNGAVAFVKAAAEKPAPIPPAKPAAAKRNKAQQFPAVAVAALRKQSAAQAQIAAKPLPTALRNGNPGREDDVFATALPPVEEPSFEPQHEDALPFAPPVEGNLAATGPAPLEHEPPQTTLGVRMPIDLPSGEDVVHGVKKLGSAVTSLIP